MSESMSSPWIRDYLLDVAETHGAQLYSTSISKGKKKIQLTDFLTYSADDYVWAWISDKDHRVSVRISKDAVNTYKTMHRRNIIDCRFFIVSISNYRPMFSPRPLGPNIVGNTTVSHISLEIDRVSLVGVAAHVFGDPRDLESDKNMKEWVLGLRQDGGGGNVLKLRKQQKIMQIPLSTPLSSSSHRVPVSQHPIKADEAVAKPKPERPQNLQHDYAKRWRVITADRDLKHDRKPVVEGRANPPLDLSSRPISHKQGHSACPEPLRCTPPPPSLRIQGTPTDWSPSTRGSPAAPDETDMPTVPQLPSDAEGHTVDTVVASDTRSLQPPTPAQRIQRSPLPCSSPPPRSSPDPSSPHLQSLSSPSPPSPSMPLPPSLPIPVGIRKDFQRKVPHPGLPAPRPDPAQHGPALVLVPNSDPSGSSQPNSQSQHLSQSQQPKLFSQSLGPLSSLSKEFKPLDTSTPRNVQPFGTPKRTSMIPTELLPVPEGDNERKITPARDKSTGKIAEASEPEPNSPALLNVPRIEILEEVESDAESEVDELQLTHNTARTEEDAGKGDTNVNHKNSRILIDNVEGDFAVHGSPHHQPASVPNGLSPDRKDTNDVTIHPSAQQSEHQSPMHSLFSDTSEDDRTLSSRARRPIAGRTEKVHGSPSPTHVPSHDSEAWKEPSFIAKKKGKGKARAIEESVVPIAKTQGKRQGSAQPEPRPSKRTKVDSLEMHHVASTAAGTRSELHSQLGTSVMGERHSDNQPSTSTDQAMQLSRPRLANFTIDFQRVGLGKGVQIPRSNFDPGIKRVLLTTGRIRTDAKVEEDGSVYIHQ